MTYRPPVRDMAFTLNEVAGLSQLMGTGAFEDLSPDLVESVMEEGAKLAAEVLAPLNRSGDAEGAKFSKDGVSVPAGFADAYRKWVEGGWGSLAATPEFGGQGLPVALSVAMQEMWNAACLSFGLCPILSQGAIEALTAHGTDEQKNLYLPKLISGEWTGTMNLTEPQAGSDLNALKAKAVPQGDGTYKITGTKIYITYGEHDLAENIAHLVLARLPDAPAGTKGISLFLVPKFLVNEDGSLGERNDAHCIGLEEKLGIHGSPTCVMAYGEQGGAIGTLIGEENRGLACHVHDDEQRPPSRRHARRRHSRSRISARIGLCERPQAGPSPRLRSRTRRHGADHRTSRHPPHAPHHEGADGCVARDLLRNRRRHRRRACGRDRG